MSRSRPKILFVSHSPHFGGAERSLYFLLKGLDRNTYDLSVLLPPRPLVRRNGQQDLGELVDELGIPVCRTPIRWWVGRWPRYMAFAVGLANRVAKIASFLRREEIDLVVSNSSVFVEGALAAQSCGIPHVWHVLEMLNQDPVLRPVVPLHQLYQLMNSLSCRIVTVSHAVKRGFDSYVQPDKLRVVYTGLPEVMPRPMDQPKKTMFDLPPDTPVVTFVGLLSERKGPVDLVDSAPEILKKFPRATFVIAGPDGGEGRKIIRKVRQYGVHHAFRILRYRHDIPDILAASDMLVLPSATDPLPLAVLEAMSAGIPVVATRSGGCEELVLQGQTGYLVPPKSPASLAKAIMALLENPQNCAQMGLNGHDRFNSHFNHRQYVANFGQVLDEACAMPRHVVQTEGACLSQAIVAQLRSSALDQVRSLAGQYRGFAQLKDYCEAMARCLSLV